MIAIGNEEACPFCKGKDKFISTMKNNFVEHLFEKHPKEAREALFGNENVGL